MKRLAIYKRVSTDNQQTDMQQHAINEWLARQVGEYHVREYEDVGFSGSLANRPALQEMKDDIDRGLIDCIVVYRLDRLSRTATDALNMLIGWLQRDIEFIAVDQPILQLDKKNPFRLTFASMLSEIAQIERETIVARIKTGLAAAKKRGVKLGRNRALNEEQLREARAMRNSGASLRAIAEHFNIGTTTTWKSLRA
jgi:DNA invertase Pin-like site-specific DNA recombinase